MFCGDETGAVVVDVGSSNARFGWSGEDTPKCVFSSVRETYFPDATLLFVSLI